MLQNIKTKYPIIARVFIFLLIIAVPGLLLKISGRLLHNNFATVFTSSMSGNWASSTTWGGANPSPVEGIDYPGINDNVIINTGIILLSGNQNAHNLTLAIGGTIDLDGHILNVRGDWRNSGGTLTLSGGGIVNFVSTTTQSILGTNTFENLTKFASTSSTLLFDQNATTTIIENLSLSGTFGNLLSIGPDTRYITPVFISKVGLNSIPGLSNPYPTIAPNGEIYVSDSGNSRIVVLNSDGTASTTYESTGLSGPRGITLSKTGEIYVINAAGSVKVLNQNGTASTTYTLGVSLRYDIAISSTTDEIYVSDYTNNQIIVLNPNGTASTTYSVGSPVGITLAHTGEIYVARIGTGVTILNPDGTASTTISGVGSAVDVAISPSGYIYIADQAGGNIYVRNPDGTASTTLGAGLSLGDIHSIAISPNSYIYSGPLNGGLITALNPNGTLLAKYNNSISGAFGSPYGVVIDSFGNIYVSDSRTFVNSVQKFDASSNFIKYLDITGHGDFNFPAHLAVDLDNNIYIADSNFNNVGRIAKFDSNGDYVTETAAILYPWGIAVDSLGNIYVNDQNNYEVTKLDSNFNIIISTTTADGLAFSFSEGGVALDPSGNFLYVFDDDNDRIVKLSTTDLSFITSSQGPVEAPFNGPKDLAFDSQGDMYVSDNSNRIIKLTPNFSYIGQWGTGGTGNGQFISPQQIAINSQDNIYVADLSNHRIQKFGNPTSVPFHVLHEDILAGTTTFSFLSVSKSINHSTSSFVCSGCVDGGVNTNWIFVPLATGGHLHSTPPPAPVVSPTATTTTVVATTTATTTIPLATTTPIIATTTATTTIPLPQIIPVIPKPVIPPVTPIPTPATPQPSTPAPTGSQTPIQAVGTNTLTSNIIQSIQQSYAQTAIVVAEAVQKVSDTVNSPTGSVVTKTVSTTGVVFGAGASVGSIIFANPITFSEIGFIPTRLLGLMLGALGIRRKKRAWGTVYDSVTKRPLDPVYVTLINSLTNKEMDTAITDLDGRYGFLVLPGMYKIVVQKTNYIFPSEKMQTALFDEVYGDLYHGGDITVLSEGEIITKNIPMDPLAFDWNEFTKNKSNINIFIKGADVTWAKISKIIFGFGSVASLIALIFAPRPYNFIIAVFYVIAYIFNYYVFQVKKSGSIIDKTTGLPLSFAIVKIFREGMMDTPMLKKITDKFGKYYSLVPKGNYTIQIDKKNDDETYTNVYQSGILSAQNGILNEDVKI